MIDQNSQFFAILTNIGVAKQANADALGIAWKITQLGVGDAKGTDPQPDATQKALINEWRRAPLNQLKQDPANPGIIIAEQVIPADVGGKWIREIGLYDADGDLVAVANCAPSFKPLLAQGSGRTQVVRMNLIVSNSAEVELKIDPSVVLATREFVMSELARQDFKRSVLVCAPDNIVLSGLQTIDDLAVTAGKRVLAPSQTAAKDRGIWVAAAGGWTRATDADISDEVTPGMLVLVEQGTLYGDSAWQLVTDAPITLGVTPLTFEMAWGRTGVHADEYRSVTVDKYGRVVAGSNPTTVAAYGLTDVYTIDRTDTALALKADAVDAALEGRPTAPTPPLSTNDKQIANTEFVQALFAALIGSAPETLDQLNELAAALGNDANFASTMMNLLATKAPLLSAVLTGTPTAPTADLSSPNGEQLANLEFVRNNLRKFVGAGIGVANEAQATLTHAQLGNWVNVSASGFPLMLPDAISVTSGLGYLVRNVSSAALTVSAPNSIASDTSGRSFVMAANEVAEFTASGSGWWVTARGRVEESAPLNAPAFKGAPTAPTPAFGDRSRKLVNAEYVTNLVTGILTRNVSGHTDIVLNADEAASAVLSFVGKLTANVSVIVPAATKSWTVYNRTTGPFTLTVKTKNGAGRMVAPGRQSQLMCNGLDMHFAQSGFADGHFSGEVVTDAPNSYRMVQGKYGAFWRNDGAHLYLLLTDSGDPHGSFNSLRPFDVNLSTGAVVIQTGLSVTAPSSPSDHSTRVPDTAWVNAAIAANDRRQVGEVTHFAMSSPPPGYLKRNGAAVSRTTYAALFAVIGTTFGVGDGSTTFNLPDSRGHFDRGWDDGRNLDTGRAFGSSQASQNLYHNHQATAAQNGKHAHTVTPHRDRSTGGLGNAVYGDEDYYGREPLTTSVAGEHTHHITVGYSGGTESRPINTAFLPCIKY